MFETTPKKLQKLQFLPDILLSKKEKKEKNTKVLSWSLSEMWLVISYSSFLH